MQQQNKKVPNIESKKEELTMSKFKLYVKKNSNNKIMQDYFSDPSTYTIIVRIFFFLIFSITISLEVNMKRPIMQNIHKYHASDRWQKSIYFPHYMVNEQRGWYPSSLVVITHVLFKQFQVVVPKALNEIITYVQYEHLFFIPAFNGSQFFIH
jgi:hypothetical protein